MRIGRRTRWTLASIASLVAGGGAAVAIAVASGGLTSTIGSPTTAAISSAVSNTTPTVWVQAADPSNGSYAAAGDGVLTHWSVGVYAVQAPGGSLALKVVRPGATAGTFTIVGEDTRTIPANPDKQTQSFDTRVPVKAGDRLAVYPDGAAQPAADNEPSARVDFGGSPTATVGQTVTLGSSYAGSTLRLRAEIEPDADGDGYGDVTQDACPGKAAKHATPCEDATTTVAATTTITTTVTTTTPSPARTCLVPALTGLTRAAATTRLQRAGCRLGRVTTRRPKGAGRGRLVVVKAPAAGSRRPAESGVPLTLGPAGRR